MADMVIIPAADAIYNEFSNAPIALLNFILTGTQLIGIASALLVIVFMRYFSKKNVIITLFAVFAITSCLGVAVKNPYYIAVMRALVGFAIGGLASAAIALINEFYREDEKKCSALVGAFTGFLSSYLSAVLMECFRFSELISLLPIYAGIALIGGILSLILTIRGKTRMAK